MAVPCAAATAAGRFTKGGQITTSAWVAFATKGANASKKAAVSAAVLYIFQLPARTGLRMSLQNSNLRLNPRVERAKWLRQSQLAELFDQFEVGTQSGDGFAALLDTGFFDDAELIGGLLQVTDSHGIDTHDAATRRVHRSQIRAHHQHARLLASPLNRPVAFHAYYPVHQRKTLRPERPCQLDNRRVDPNKVQLILRPAVNRPGHQAKEIFHREGRP